MPDVSNNTMIGSTLSCGLLPSRMKILFFLPVWEPAWQYGGPIQSTFNLCKSLQNLGVQIKVVTTSFGLSDWPNSSCDTEILRSDLPVTYFKAKSSDFFGINSPSLLASLQSYLDWADVLHMSAVWHPMSIGIQNWQSNVIFP